MSLEQSRKTKKKTPETSSFGTCFHNNFQLKFQSQDWYKIGTNYRTNFEPKQQAHFPFTFFSWTLIFLIFSFNPNRFVLFFKFWSRCLENSVNISAKNTQGPIPSNLYKFVCSSCQHQRFLPRNQEQCLCCLRLGQLQFVFAYAQLS